MRTIVKGVRAALIVSLVGMSSVSPGLAAHAADVQVTHETAQETEQAALNELSQLEIDGVQLGQTFSPGLKQYTATVKNSMDTIKLLVKSDHENSVITVNGKPVVSGETIHLSVQTGKNTFTIKVDDQVHAVSTYTLTVTREKNGNKKTDTLKVIKNANKPSSNPAQSKRTNSFGKKITVPSHSNLATSHKQLSSGKVQRLNGLSGQQTTRNSAAMKQKISKATLSALSVSAGTRNKAFSSSSYTYHITVSKGVDAVTINASATYSGSTIQIEGNTAKTIQIPNQKKTIISVVVTNGEDRKTYVLVFQKNLANAGEESNVSTDHSTSNDVATETAAASNATPSAATNSSSNAQGKDTSVSLWSRFVGMIRSFLQSF